MLRETINVLPSASSQTETITPWTISSERSERIVIDSTTYFGFAGQETSEWNDVVEKVLRDRVDAWKKLAVL